MAHTRLIAASLWCLASTAASTATAQTAAPVAGCWRTDRPLGPTGGSAPVDRDSLFRTVVLQDSGHVAFPLLGPSNQSAMWTRRSFWRTRGDSVIVRFFTGLQGWDATLVRAADGHAMRGTATYLSDAIAVGHAPTRVVVTFAGVACEPAWPGTRSVRPPLRPWERDEHAFFASQVDRPAALLPNSPLPRGTIASRAVRHDEHASDSTDRRRGSVRIVLQFMIEKDGRADTTRLRVLFADDSTGAREVARSLPAMRFAPALVKGQPVHQLAQWVFELRRP